jgi:preprotein translocase subunit SecF
MKVVKYRKIFFAISSLLVLVSIGLVIFGGLNFGIDFTGGSILEIEYIEERPEISELRPRLDLLELSEYRLQPTGEKGLVLRTRNLKESERISAINLLSESNGADLIEKRFNTVGPVIGDELRQKAYVAIAIVVVAIILFIAFAFRKVSEPAHPDDSVGRVSSWKYGFVAILALIHDIIIPTGVFALLGLFSGAEVDILFVTALLAILGFSVNDTIVVFDRVRENLRLNQERNIKEDFEDTVGKSLNQTFARSINTSLTTLIVLLALFFLGGEPTKYFTLTLMIGVIAGTYSSIFLASPLLISLSSKE